jgi:hypothetical protein
MRLAARLSARTPRPTPICATSPAAWTAVVTTSGAELGGPLRRGGGGGGVGRRGASGGGAAAAFGLTFAVVLGFAAALGFAAVLGFAAAFAFVFGFGFGLAAVVAVLVDTVALVALACLPSRFGRVAGSEPRTDASGLAVRLALFFAVLLLAGLSLIGVVWDARSDDLGAALW